MLFHILLIQINLECC